MNLIPNLKEVDLTELFTIEAYQKRFGGKKRSELKSSDFLFPATRSYPITSPDSIRKAIHDYGRGNHGLSYEAFIHKLWHKAKEKGFESGMPESTKEKYNLK